MSMHQWLLAPLKRAEHVLPTPLASLLFAGGLDLARRLRWLQPPPELEGCRFAINISDLQRRLCFRCENGRFRPIFSGPVALELHAKFADFLTLLEGQEDADTLFFQRRLRIQGDTELGLLVKNWLDSVERPQWLSRWAIRRM